MFTNIFKVVLFFCSFYFTIHLSYSQSCSGCVSTNSNNQPAGTAAVPRVINNNNTGWSPSFPNTSGIARFPNSGFFRWAAGGGNTITISGLILEENVTLILDRSNDNIFEAFEIIGGCIVVKSGAVLDFRYFTALENVSICVEDGGTLRFDSRRGGAGVRDNFVFDNVIIDLKGENAVIDFDDADLIIQEGGLSILGWTGSEVCTGNPPVPPSSGTSGNISWTGSTINICGLLNFNVLPVEYLYFKSTFQPQERAVQLNWATAKEWENSHFEIQRSVNGVGNWEKIGEVKGAGWSEMPVEYLFTDEMLPLTGGNVFYRLKQVDFNGDFAYSEVVSARVPSLQFTNGVWRVFPNPTNGDVFRIELLDTKRYNGEAIQANLITPAAGRKSLLGSNTASIAEEVLELLNANGKGVYILEIAWSNKVEHIKILKQ